MNFVLTEGHGKISKIGWCGTRCWASVGLRFGGRIVVEFEERVEGLRTRRKVRSQMESVQSSIPAILKPAFIT